MTRAPVGQNVLVVNCGSSTLKFEVFAVDWSDDPAGVFRSVCRGAIDRIGGDAVLQVTREDTAPLSQPVRALTHDEATSEALHWLSTNGFPAGGFAAAGHRVVHGGDRFVDPAYIDNEVLAGIDALTELAPLHNGPALRSIRTAQVILGPSVPMIAVFDTAFHRRMPDVASHYAIPFELAAKHHIRRYGFHGLAHRSMVEQYAAMTGMPLDQTRLITLQLGNGCSVAAVKGGQSIDTSMGFTPLEGLVMGTRSGDLDPAVVGFLARREQVTVEEVEQWLTSRSGLLGVSGQTRDMRDLLEAEAQGDARAALAVNMFCYRARKYVGAYLAALGGADAVVFGGGIGEHAASVRSRICADMSWCGLQLDGERNAQVHGALARISADNATIQAYVIPVDEALVIARDTARFLSGGV